MVTGSSGRPRIGVTSRFRQAIESHSVHRGYIDQVTRSGALPITIPTLGLEFCEEFLDAVDGLLLTGGEDIDPDYCTGSIRRPDYVYHPRRDAFELRLARLALDRGLPVLGICRGSQILWALTGNPLIAHIPDVNDHQVLHRTSLTEVSRHVVSLAPGSKVAGAYGESKVEVTSYHHQGLGEQAPGGLRWEVTARADDSLVEGFERAGAGAPWAVGVLWHPELPADDDERTDPLIAAFVSAAGAA
ncbi:gamma-glutamyl-gamma-aminobutyrate hydrolase family protein [Streptomyces sp. NBC_01565]|uniref:gamma-glutamyl-gamma-aminobutyrate hydrolase family protein n=1 Tax=unclassified Streptomyces TaxID=2593676 RepID=UPI00225B0A0A|nr:gamma-glutamyl-gamma-aminobutyrate hydrolase family protein [Streptomyces sp. NBC_01565]MCX4539395.1 gamma-glutamyl-gamma-aminobutyrate hydrolase family protein [Streptomyces sp. NBC_01565]